MAVLRRFQYHAFHTQFAYTIEKPPVNESSARYGLQHVSFHLSVLKDHEKLWQLATDNVYIEEQIRRTGGFDASFQLYRRTIALYIHKGGQLPSDDERLCWLVLRASQLSENSKQYSNQIIASCFEQKIAVHDAIQQIDFLDSKNLFTAYWKLLMIAAWQEKNRRTGSATPQKILEKIEGIPKKEVLWTDFIPEELMIYWLTLMLEVWGYVDFAPIYQRGERGTVVQILCVVAHNMMEKDIHLAMKIIDNAVELASNNIFSRYLNPLIKTAAQKELLEYSKILVNYILDEKEHVLALCNVAYILAEKNQKDEAAMWYQNALSLLRTKKKNNILGGKSDLLRCIAIKLSEQGFWELSKKTIHDIEMKHVQSKATLDVFCVLLRTRGIPLAKQFMDEVTSYKDEQKSGLFGFLYPYDRAFALAELALSYIEEGKKEESISLFEDACAFFKNERENPHFDTMKVSITLADIAIRQFRGGFCTHAVHTFQRSIDQVQNILIVHDKDKANYHIVGVLSEAMLHELIFALTKTISIVSHRDRLLDFAAERILEFGDPERALTVAEHISESLRASKIYGKISHRYAQKGDFEHSMDIANRIRSQEEIVLTWARIALELFKRGQIEKSKELFHKATTSLSLYEITDKNIYEELAIHLLHAGEMTLIQKIVDMNIEERLKLKISYNHALFLMQNKEQDRAKELLHKSIEIHAPKDSNLEPLSHICSLMRSNSLLPDPSEFLLGRAKKIANDIPEPNRKATAFLDLLDATHRKDFLLDLAHDTYRAARAIPAVYRRDFALEKLGKVLNKHGFIDFSIQIAQELEPSFESYEIMANAGIKLAEMGDGRATEILTLAKGIASKLEIEEYLVALSDLAKKYYSLGNVAHAQEIFELALGRSYEEKEEDVSESQVVISYEMAECGFFDEALEATFELGDVHTQSEPYSMIAQDLAKEGHLERSLEVADKIFDKHYKAETLSSIARYYHLSGNNTAVEKLIRYAIELANSSKIFQAQTLATISKTLAQCSLWDQSLALAQSIDEQVHKDRAMVTLIEYLMQHHQIEKSHSIIPLISDAEKQAVAFQSIAKEMLSLGQEDAVFQKLYRGRFSPTFFARIFREYQELGCTKDHTRKMLFFALFHQKNTWQCMLCFLFASRQKPDNDLMKKLMNHFPKLGLDIFVQGNNPYGESHT